MYLVIKYLLSAAIVVGVSEIGKRSPGLGGLLASLPLTSYLAILWIYYETGNDAGIAALSQSIFWLVLPSLVLFLALTALLRMGLPFAAALTAATLSMLAAYGAMIALLRYFGIPF